MEDSRSLYSLILTLIKVCEGTQSEAFNKQIFSVKFKILFLIYNYGQVSPSVLVSELNMAKSNVALFCKQLLAEQFIVGSVDKFDHRIVYYSLTKKGQKQVENNLNYLQTYLEGCCSQLGLKTLSKNTRNILQIISKMGANKDA